MLFTETEFKKYKLKIFKIFGEYEDRDEFETYLQNKLNTNNLKIYISNILRAINIVLGNDTNKYINEIDDLNLLVKLNLSKNKDKLLEFKEDERVKRYLKNVNKDKLAILIKLSEVLDDIDIEKLDLSNIQIQKSNDTLSNIEDTSNKSENFINKINKRKEISLLDRCKKLPTAQKIKLLLELDRGELKYIYSEIGKKIENSDDRFSIKG